MTTLVTRPLRHRGFVCIPVLGGLLFSPIAPAQTQSTSGSGDETGSNGLEEVVVTAQKREQTVNKTSIAVTALSPTQLQEAGVVSIRDLTSAVPNVQIHTIGPVGYSGIAIRGISNQDFSQLGSPAVATYVDGVYVAVSQALTGALYDIDRIEVLRGPQGTTYGQNATGGNVNIVTARPVQSFAASADVSYGNYNDIQTHGMVNIPVTDELAIRAAVAVHRSDGYFDTEGTTARNYGAADEFGARVSALWTPAEGFEWKLVFEGFNNQGTPSNMLLEQGANGQPINGRSPFSQPFLGPHPEPQIDLEGYSIRSRIDWDIADSLSLAYIAGYQHQESNFIFGILGQQGQQVYDGNWFDDVDAYTNEINLTFDRGRLHNILGASQFSKKNPYAKAFHFHVLSSNILIPGGAEQTSEGVFDQATFSISDTLRIIGGIRFSHESQNTRGAFDTIICPMPAGGLVPYAEIFALDAQSAGCVAQTTPYGRGSWSNTSWKAGLEWDLSPQTMTYVSVTNGFKSGQVQPGLPSVLPSSVDPEEAINYELGAKSRLLAGTLDLRIALFNEDYENIQVTKVTTLGVPATPYVFSENAGQAQIYGAELEWQYAISGSDRFSGFFNYTNATYSEYRNAFDGRTGSVTPSLEGRFLPNAPELSARVQYSHDFALPNGGMLTPMAGVYYQSKSYLREFNLPIDRLGAYTKSTVNLTYADPSGHWTASAFVDNLEDETIRNSGNTAVNSYFSDYHSPRLFGVRVSYEY